MAKRFVIFLIFTQITILVIGQDSTRIRGQLSSWLNLNKGNEFPLWGGARYIPQFNYSTKLETKGQYDAEVSANIFGSAGLNPFDTITGSGKIKPYRAWIRYSTEQFEIRLGLQKINFGSALMLRPLMWFDQLDPRDPLQLTDGVWGVLGRYYFLNNSNLWFWSLYGNNQRRGWEYIPVNNRIPEFGGRFQFPVPKGEMALTYHHRTADSRFLDASIPAFNKIPENRIGFDAKWNLITGFWVEGAYSAKSRNIGIYTNQMILNSGIDYTFNIGSGLYTAFEQLLATYDTEPFEFSNKISFSLMTVGYSMGIFDRLSTIIYYNWSGSNVYSFFNWQRQFDRVMFYVMAYWNPDSVQLPAQTDSRNIFGGKGVQLMFVYNH